MSDDVRQRLNPPRDYLREKFSQVEARENRSMHKREREQQEEGQRKRGRKIEQEVKDGT